MRVSELGHAGLRRRLSADGLLLATGPFVTRIRSRIPSVAEEISSLYPDCEVHNADSFYDFDCELRPPRSLRRFYRPQVVFLSDQRVVFKPLPRHQAYPMLEWGMNWCIASHVQNRLVLHAAALERNGRALILPAPPGSGKSTLCAALASHGWRLMTDESVLVALDTAEISGPARPISLKNASINVIRDFCPEANVNTPVHDTLKGTVAHMRPPRDAVERARQRAPPAWVVFPRFRPGADTRLLDRAPGEAFMGLVANAFNYAALGGRAFHAIGDLVDRTRAFDFTYSRLDEAMATFEALADGRQ